MEKTKAATGPKVPWPRYTTKNTPKDGLNNFDGFGLKKKRSSVIQKQLSPKKGIPLS